jgi:hypothetical protein
MGTGTLSTPIIALGFTILPATFVFTEIRLVDTQTLSTGVELKSTKTIIEITYSLNELYDFIKSGMTTQSLIEKILLR